MLKPAGEGLSRKGCPAPKNFQKYIGKNLTNGRFVAGDDESMDS